MSKAKQYEQIILQTNQWYEKKVDQLKFLIENKEDNKILFEGKEGDKVELPEKLKEGFFFGLQTAIEILGEFPVKISKTNDNNQTPT